MVPIRTYKGFWDYLKTVITTIDWVFVVSDLPEIKEYIKKVADGDILLVAVIPSSDTDAMNTDNLEETDSCYVFLLKKNSRMDLTPETLFSDREETQQIITQIKHTMWQLASDFDHEDVNTRLMRRLLLNKMHTDPEYDFLGCDGWSLSFTLNTAGMSNE